MSKQLVTEVASAFSITKKLASEVIDFIFTGVLEEAINEGKCKTAIGTFNVKVRAARKGRNPKTGEAITTPAKKVLSLKVPKSVQLAL
jgi:DNA-binding protein HU-beta